ncbi:MAG: RNA polymerase factor sigma-54 [Anaerotruncus sp.]|nr:RNA polymerase factor sigma-54 [Anaerotruncus sp.]
MELEIRLSQTQTLSPQMEQSVRILQMDSAQLGAYLKEMMLENPVMEFEHPKEEDPKEDLALRKLEWLESQTVKEKENVGYYEEEENGNILEKTVASVEDESLVDHLLTQISFVSAPPDTLAAARYLVGFIDENGYLTTDQLEIEQDSSFTPEQLGAGLELVQGLDPTGVGASDLCECLCLQLAPEDTLARALVANYLEDIAKNRFGQLAKQFGVPLEQITAAIERIRHLNPKPGALYAKLTPPNYITPDVVVTSFENQYNVMLCEFSYPEIRLSESYLRMANETSDKEVISYISNKVNQVNWIKKCIESRNRTLLAVARAIVRRQERFFRYGPQFLNVLRMRDVAEMVEMHESTVSRAVRDKYLQCAHGVYPLRYFFVKGVESEDGDSSGTSTHDIKWKIRTLIEEEDKANPLSDQKITDLLEREGLNISRRTVAKYREELGFLKSSQRQIR